ncbi:FecR family protein, partial [bacterium]|nr:FecR family protein [bacterium]
MKNVLLFTVFTFVFLLNFQTYLHAQVKKANAKGIAMVTVTYIQGQVEVKKSNDKEWTLAKLNMILHQEDRLRTRLLSNTEIKFEDGSIVKVGENTMIDIKELTLDRETLEQESSIKLWLGKIRARIEKLRQKNSRFNVITPTAIVGVRGTTFIVCVEEDKTTKALVEVGEIYFRGSSQLPEEEVTLKSSEFSISSTDGTKVTPPQKISPEEIEKIKEEVKEIKSLEIIENKEEPKDKDKEVSSPTKDPAKEETSPEVIETKKEDPE